MDISTIFRVYGVVLCALSLVLLGGAKADPRADTVGTLIANYSTASTIVSNCNQDIANWVCNNEVTLNLLQNVHLNWWALNEKYAVQRAGFYTELEGDSDLAKIISLDISKATAQQIIANTADSELYMQRKEYFVRLGEDVITETFELRVTRARPSYDFETGEIIEQMESVKFLVIVTASPAGILNVERFEV